MKYLKEYNSFEQLWDAIDSDQIIDYYSVKVQFPKNLSDKLQDLTGQTKFSQIDVYNNEHEHWVDGLKLKVSSITLNCWKDRHCAWYLDIFYTSDEWFVCMLEKYFDGKFVDSDPDDIINYKCDGIEGLRQFIKEIDTWD